ncbi:hypothetical protein Vi05172_g12693 [Venturia inaequalis]|nr:hypothetical protein Vi05172_g12693 [Venturia inaequalis]
MNRRYDQTFQQLNSQQLHEQPSMHDTNQHNHQSQNPGANIKRGYDKRKNPLPTTSPPPGSKHKTTNPSTVLPNKSINAPASPIHNDESYSNQTWASASFTFTETSPPHHPYRKPVASRRTKLHAENHFLARTGAAEILLWSQRGLVSVRQ